MCIVKTDNIHNHGHWPLPYRAEDCEFTRFEQAADKTLTQRLFQYVTFLLFYAEKCGKSTKKNGFQERQLKKTAVAINNRKNDTMVSRKLCTFATCNIWRNIISIENNSHQRTMTKEALLHSLTENMRDDVGFKAASITNMAV